METTRTYQAVEINSGTRWTPFTADSDAEALALAAKKTGLAGPIAHDVFELAGDRLFRAVGFNVPTLDDVNAWLTAAEQSAADAWLAAPGPSEEDMISDDIEAERAAYEDEQESELAAYREAELRAETNLRLAELGAHDW